MSENQDDIWQKIIASEIFDDKCDGIMKQIIINLCSNCTEENFMENIPCPGPDMLKKCLMLVCIFCNDVNVIKYLMESEILDVSHTDKFSADCLLSACWGNANLG